MKPHTRLLIKALTQRRQYHHVDAVSRVVEREKERNELILKLYGEINSLHSKCLSKGTSIALREVQQSKEGECICLFVDAVFCDTETNKWYYTLSSPLPAHREFFERIKFSLELFSSLVYQELGLKLK